VLLPERTLSTLCGEISFDSTVIAEHR